MAVADQVFRSCVTGLDIVNVDALIFPADQFSRHDNGRQPFSQFVELTDGNITTDQQQSVHSSANQRPDGLGFGRLLPLTINKQGRVTSASQTPNDTLCQCIVEGASDVLGQHSKCHGSATGETAGRQVGFEAERLHRFEDSCPFVFIDGGTVVQYSGDSAFRDTGVIRDILNRRFTPVLHRLTLEVARNHQFLTPAPP